MTDETPDRAVMDLESALTAARDRSRPARVARHRLPGGRFPLR